MKKLISIICPLYNEEASVEKFLLEIQRVFNDLDYLYEVIFVDDGSLDKTLLILNGIFNKYDFKYISFTRNFGKDAALTAGFTYSTGDAVIPMDVDLQDPPDLIPKMLCEWQNGYDVVLAKRVNRKGDNAVKRKLAQYYYSLMNKIGDTYLEENVGDFRLMSRSVISDVLSLTERTRYMKGLLSWVGHKVKIIEFSRPSRNSGFTKFRLKQQLYHGLDGITSFSVFPLRVISIIGILISLFSICYGIFIIFYTLVFGRESPGYASLFVGMSFLGGIQLISLGVIGEYVGRIYLEAKQRPIYLIKETKGWN